MARIWHGYTDHSNADAYEHMLKSEIFSGIEKRNIEGFKNIQLLRRQIGNEVEFITIMWFDSLESVKQFAGKEYEKAVVYPEAKPLLIRYDERSQHYEVKN